MSRFLAIAALVFACLLPENGSGEIRHLTRSTSKLERKILSDLNRPPARYIEVYFVNDMIENLRSLRFLESRLERVEIDDFTGDDAAHEFERLFVQERIGLADLRRPQATQKRRLRVAYSADDIEMIWLQEGKDAEPAALGDPLIETRVSPKAIADAFNNGRFLRTDRNLMSQAKHLEVLGDLKTLRGPVLDMGCGGGTIVRELRRMGLDARGLDLVLSRDQVEESGVFSAGDMAYTSYPDETFQVIFNLWSIFHYAYSGGVPSKAEAAQLKIALKETRRILKVGGISLISPINRPEPFSELVSQIPGLRVKQVFRTNGGAKSGVLLERLY